MLYINRKVCFIRHSSSLTIVGRVLLDTPSKRAGRVPSYFSAIITYSFFNQLLVLLTSVWRYLQ